MFIDGKYAEKTLQFVGNDREKFRDKINSEAKSTIYKNISSLSDAELDEDEFIRDKAKNFSCFVTTFTAQIMGLAAGAFFDAKGDPEEAFKLLNKKIKNFMGGLELKNINNI